MNDTCAKESLKKFRLTIESLELSKQIAAAKWLEGVVVAQVLTNEEREEIVEAANEYVGKVEEEKYVDAINALVEYLELVEKSTSVEQKRLKR
jgi:hypothetical protein